MILFSTCKIAIPGESDLIPGLSWPAHRVPLTMDQDSALCKPTSANTLDSSAQWPSASQLDRQLPAQTEEFALQEHYVRHELMNLHGMAMEKPNCSPLLSCHVLPSMPPNHSKSQVQSCPGHGRFWNLPCHQRLQQKAGPETHWTDSLQLEQIAAALPIFKKRLFVTFHDYIDYICSYIVALLHMLGQKPCLHDFSH